MATMTLGEAIESSRSILLQNGTSAWYDDPQYVLYINNALSMIYDEINSTINWYHSLIEEEISPNNDGITFEPTYIMSKILFVLGPRGEELKKERCSLKNPNLSGQFIIDRHGRIVLYEQKEKVTLIYHRKPKKLTASDKSEELDIPEDLEWLVMDLVARKALPVYLYNGAQLANNYYSQFVEQIRKYIQNVGYIDEQHFVNESF